MKRHIYLDNNATTKPSPEVVEGMNTALTREWFNPSAHYPPAKQIQQSLSDARRAVAKLAGVTPAEIVFTSGGTESINAAIFGIAALKTGKHILTTTVEHAATTRALELLQGVGYEVTRLGVDFDGQISLSELEQAIRPEETALVSIMLANNETGVLFPMEDIARICQRHRVLLHVDAVQALGKIPVRASQVADLMSFAGHKLHGPKGVGALYVRRHLKLQTFVSGGDQEGGRRAGTENVPGIIGFGIAATQALNHFENDDQAVARLRDKMEKSIQDAIPCIRINGNKASRLPNTSSLTFSGVDAKQLAVALAEKGIYISTGSACATGSNEPSHVLLAMGREVSEALSTIRVSLAAATTETEITEFVRTVYAQVIRMRSNSLHS